MTEFRIDIIINTRRAATETRRVRNELQRTETAASRLARVLRRAFLFIGIAAGIRQLVRLADTFTTIQNRLRTVTTGQRELTASTQALFDISQRTRSSFQSTAEVFTRVALAARELGQTQAELLQFTESLNQAVILSGATAQEASAGLLQLSQGLASGALRGDELRSVLESLPVVADVIADSLGVTRGQLRELGKEGKISAEVVLQAFAEAREELEDRFGETIPTVAQSFQRLRDAVLLYVGSADQALGISAAFSRFISLLSDNVAFLAQGVQALAVFLGIGLAAVAIPAAISAFVSLSTVLLANPFTAIAVGIAGVISLLVAFADVITLGAGSVTTLEDVFVASFMVIRGAAETAVEGLATVFNQLAVIAGASLGEVDITVRDVLNGVARLADFTLGLFRGVLNGAVLIVDGAGIAISDIFVQAVNGVRAIIEGGLDIALALFGTIQTQASVVGRSLLSFFREIAAASFLLVTGQAEAATRVASDAIEGFGKQLARAVIDIPQVFESTLQRLGDTDFVAPLANPFAGAAERLGERVMQGFVEGFNVSFFRDTLNEVLMIADRISAERENIRREEANRPPSSNLGGGGGLSQPSTAAALSPEAQNALENIQGPQMQFMQTQMALNELLDRGKISAEEYAIALNQAAVASNVLSTNISGGLAAGLAQARLNFTDLSGAAADLVVNGFNAAEDALANFITTGTLDFSAFVDGLIADIARLIAKQALLGIVGGGAGGGALSILGFQDGGRFRANQPIIVGEEGPELLTPETGGNITPAGETAAMLRAAGTQQAPQVNVEAPAVNIMNVIEGESDASREDFILNTIAANPQTISSLSS